MRLSKLVKITTIAMASLGLSFSALTPAFADDTPAEVTLTCVNNKPYVNGHPIDISFSFSTSFSIPEGYYRTNMSLTAKPETRVFEAHTTNFTTTWENSYAKPGALKLHLYNIEGTSSRVTGGAYYTEPYNEVFNDVVVIVDPDNGKIIDMLTSNVYYALSYRRYYAWNIKQLEIPSECR